MKKLVSLLLPFIFAGLCGCDALLNNNGSENNEFSQSSEISSESSVEISEEESSTGEVSESVENEDSQSEDLESDNTSENENTGNGSGGGLIAPQYVKFSSNLEAEAYTVDNVSFTLSYGLDEEDPHKPDWIDIESISIEEQGGIVMFVNIGNERLQDANKYVEMAFSEEDYSTVLYAPKVIKLSDFYGEEYACRYTEEGDIEFDHAETFSIPAEMLTGESGRIAMFVLVYWLSDTGVCWAINAGEFCVYSYEIEEGTVQFGYVGK